MRKNKENSVRTCFRGKSPGTWGHLDQERDDCGRKVPNGMEERQPIVSWKMPSRDFSQIKMLMRRRGSGSTASTFPCRPRGGRRAGYAECEGLAPLPLRPPESHRGVLIPLEHAALSVLSVQLTFPLAGCAVLRLFYRHRQERSSDSLLLARCPLGGRRPRGV